MIGKLKFKGKFQEKQNKIEEKGRKLIEKKEQEEHDFEFLKERNKEKKEIIKKFDSQSGSGQIITSGRSVRGDGTKFK